jgi:hypothetical protein
MSTLRLWWGILLAGPLVAQAQSDFLAFWQLPYFEGIALQCHVCRGRSDAVACRRIS